MTRAQLLAAGISGDEIKHRIRIGVLIVVHRGVYRVGHMAPSLEARYLAAVLACGAYAVLSGRAAAYLLGLLKGQAPAPEVTTPRERRVRGVRVTRSRSRAPAERMIWRGILVTTPPRTLVDLAAELDEEELAKACHEAGVRFGTTPAQVEAVLARRPGSRGAAKLRRIMRGDTPVTLSKLESRFIRVLTEAGLPLPRTNKVASERRVDCRWPERSLTVELDSYRYHSSRHAWERDRRREREAYARGDQFRRFTYGDVFERPRQMLTELGALLAENAGR